MKDYLFDSTFDGYLTALFTAYKDENQPKLFHQACYMPNLTSEAVIITTDTQKAERVSTSILQKLSEEVLENLYYLFLASYEEAPTLGLSYLKLCYAEGGRINLAKNNPLIKEVDRIVRQVHFEVHRFVGFVRFKELAPHLYYSEIEPDHNILPLLINHFVTRFSDQSFMIHDVKRKAAIVYNGKECFIQYLTPEEAFRLTHMKVTDEFEALFTAYYRSTTIKERVNERRRDGFMPRRYHKYLFEVHKESPS